MFASHTTTTVTVPGETPGTVTIHKLSGKDFDAAQLAHMTGFVTGHGRNWSTKFLRVAQAGIATEADALKVLADPLSGFDRLELVKRGVAAWSCLNAKGEPLPVTPQAIEDLDDETLELLATEVLRLTKPRLFLSAKEAEGEQKNG